ncbi:nucleotidyl transferase AbiEii/AbiGii toxin family protein [Bosea rubneri]|uniref:Nucleotidyl transferase AbiEii/AbiGii toxin family protein n=1 Tax=Bosea rubneri TaxID=3075434 RepID=A0ABU3S6S9_9HYPH|nr:nucleotidyl transferase AbiEii/AbiGii toxin family protein [Bosea sp. ZW T0_25]MDU0340495.1 nucleotidyl transferase AbiEii/AbiGii toxin family protein [Bosea sp. ZW T0_25]
MAANERYRQQVALLVRALPAVAGEDCFALKGGTAINLFVRDMPRLSVDIDLTFLPVAPRDESLVAIEQALLRIRDRLKVAINGVQITESRPGATGPLTRLVVQLGRVQIKIEVTPVLRGCVYAPAVHAVSPSVEDQFGFAEISVVSFADLYAGKIMAALDRQHPRDLFDVQDLLANEGIDDDLRRAFIVYLISHGRPMAEVLGSAQKDIAVEFTENFEGMTTEPVALEALLAARAALIAAIVGGMPQAHKDFLLGFKRGAPDWDLLGVPGAAELPAVAWKQANLDKLNRDVRARLVAQLTAVLAPDGRKNDAP